MTNLSFAKSTQGPSNRRAGEVLRAARTEDQAGRLDPALAGYADAIRLAEQSGEKAIHIEALRRLAVIHHRRNSAELAGELCLRSYSIADDIGDRLQAGEALNALGGFDIETGEMLPARRHLQRALALVGEHDDLRGRVEQNLGVIASIQGDGKLALAHYTRALSAFERTGNARDRAIVLYNMALIARAEGELELAVTRLAQSAELAKTLGDLHLEGLCHLGQAEVSCDQQLYSAAKSSVLRALEIFELVDLPMDRSGAHRILGMVYRETGKQREAAHQFRRAVQLAEETRWMIGEAEALREMARLNEQSDCKTEAVTLLTVAHGLFSHVEARSEMAEVSRRLTALAAA